MNLLKKNEQNLPHVCEWKERAQTLESRLRAFRENFAFVDPETGLGNAAHFMRDAAKFIAHANRTSEPFALAVAEVQGSSVGRALPSEVVDEVAKLLTGACRTEDSVCRLTGESFAILLQGAVLEGAKEYAQRAGWLLGGACVQSRGRPVFLTAVFGLAEWSDGVTIEDMLDRAAEDIERFEGSLNRHRSAFEGRREEATPEQSRQAALKLSPRRQW